VLKQRQNEIEHKAARALEMGRAADSWALYKDLLAYVTTFEAGVYTRWLEGAAAACSALGKRLEQGVLTIAMDRYAEAEQLFDKRHAPVAWAQCAVRSGHPRDAVACLSDAGYPVLAAEVLESTGQLSDAISRWESLLQAPRLFAQPYETALAHTLVAGLHRRSVRESVTGNASCDRAEAHGIEAVQRLESAATRFEAQGHKERAFDCYVLMVRLGRDRGVFEDLAEGYGNAIRILMADHQPWAPLQYTDDFIKEAAGFSEWEGAAFAAERAAAHCQRLGLEFESHYRWRCGALWLKAADKAAHAAWSAGFVEGCLNKALEAAGTCGAHDLLATVYGRLAQTCADVPLAARYEARAKTHAAKQPRRISQNEAAYPRLGGAQTQSASLFNGDPIAETALPEHRLIANPYPQFDRDDLREWELKGDVVDTLLCVLAEKHTHIRFARLALLALIKAMERSAFTNDSEHQVAVAQALGDVQLYEVLSPLKKLFDQGDASVRVAVVKAVSRVLNKRSFVLINLGLRDPELLVQNEACRSLRALHFAEALDPLKRIFAGSVLPEVQSASLHAIAEIGSLEAGQFLIEVVLEAPEPLRVEAGQHLAGLARSELIPALNEAVAVSQGGVRETLEIARTALAPLVS